MPVEFKDLQAPISNNEKNIRKSRKIDLCYQPKHTLRDTAMLLLHRDVRVTPMECNEQQGTGIENGSNGAVNFDQTGQTEKSGPP